MQIALAPMEGLIDDVLRDVLTRVGGVDLCVTEFIRITDRLLPPHCFLRLAPELEHGARTHARTKTDGYCPPAHWEWIARVRKCARIPVVANGESWSVDDWLRCRAISGADDFMLGRGLVARRA